jgi:hypothetical protein
MWSPVAVGEALNLIGWGVVQLFYVSTSGFLLLLLEWKKCNTKGYPIEPKAIPATIRNWRKQHIQPIGNKEMRKKDSHWLLESRKWK